MINFHSFMVGHRIVAAIVILAITITASSARFMLSRHTKTVQAISYAQATQPTPNLLRRERIERTASVEASAIQLPQQEIRHSIYLPFVDDNSNEPPSKNLASEEFLHRQNDRFEPMTAAEETALLERIAAERIGMRPDQFRSGVTGSPHVVGTWSAPFDWPVIALHTSLIPDGRVVTWGQTHQYSPNDLDRYTAIWDPVTGAMQREPVDSNEDLFCSGHVVLANGDLFVAGGESSNGGSKELSFTHVFDLATSQWTKDNSMAAGRWYPSITPLNDGGIFISGGGPQRPEVRAADGTIRLLENINPLLGREFPWQQLAPNGELFFFGPDDKLAYINTAAAGSWSDYGERGDEITRSYGGYALFDIGKILVVGGGAQNNSAQIIDINGATPTITNTMPMAHQRYQHNTTILADGTVIAIGGNNTGNLLFDAASSVFEPEIWDPATGNWSPMASMVYSRQYHSTALLLPDGRVLVAGGGLCNICESNGYHNLNAEIFSPPYLFDSAGNLATRPVIDQIPAQIQPNTQFIIDTPDANTIAKVALIQLGAATHSVNMTQRYIPLTYNQVKSNQVESSQVESNQVEPNQLVVTAPADFNIAPPGFYMAIILDNQGTPSIAKIIQLIDSTINVISPQPAPTNRPTATFTPTSIPTETLIATPIATSINIVTPAVTSISNSEKTQSPTETPTPIPAQPLTIADIVSTPRQTNTQINFSATATGGSGSLQYHWHFGEGTQIGPQPLPAAKHSYASPGRYLVTLTVHDSAGDQASTQFIQEVYLPLTANRPTNSTTILYEERNTADRIWNVNPDNDTVSVFTITGNKQAEIAVGDKPRTLAFAPNGNIWVVNQDSATITSIDQTTLAIVQSITLPTGSQPFGIAFTPDGSAAFVTLEATGQLLKLDPINPAKFVSIAIGADPRHLSIDAQSSKVYVSRFITPPVPGEDTAAPEIANGGGEILVVDTASMSVSNSIRLHHSTATDSSSSGGGLPNYLGALVISPDGLSAQIPSKQDNIGRGTLRNGSHLNSENTVRAITSHIDLTTETESIHARLDLDNASIASAATYNKFGTLLLVTLETSREVSAIDPHNGSELFRFVAGRAPQGVVLAPDGKRAYVHNFMDRTITVHDIAAAQQNISQPIQQIANFGTVTTESLPPQVFIGKQLFYDARDPRLAKDGYMSCASCHADGGHDGRIWDLTGSGEGLRNTIALNGRGGPEHGLLHWSANFDEVNDFEAQIRSLAGGEGLMDTATFATTSDPLGTSKRGNSSDLDALAAYIHSLTSFGLSPYRATDGSLTSSGTAGRLIFEAEGCATCHGGTGYTDSATAARHNIGTIAAHSGNRLNSTLDGLDTPTLRGLWRTAPYLHDGSASTLDEAVQAHNLVTLDHAVDLNNLVEFLKQIDDIEPAISSRTPPIIPVNMPTATPTDTLTDTPTPTLIPTDTPTPTLIPTLVPTDTPTPTLIPTLVPTDTPTMTPTVKPSNTPIPPSDTPTETPIAEEQSLKCDPALLMAPSVMGAPGSEFLLSGSCFNNNVRLGLEVNGAAVPLELKTDGDGRFKIAIGTATDLAVGPYSFSITEQTGAAEQTDATKEAGTTEETGATASFVLSSAFALLPEIDATLEVAELYLPIQKSPQLSREHPTPESKPTAMGPTVQETVNKMYLPLVNR